MYVTIMMTPLRPRINLMASLIEFPHVLGSAPAGAYIGSETSRFQLT
jgi:hypothetical protein